MNIKKISAIIGSAALVATGGYYALTSNQTNYKPATQYMMNMTSADTFALQSGTNYYFGQLNGIDSNHKMTFVIQDDISLVNGIEIENCNNIQIISLNGHRCKITGTGSNTGLNIHGTDSYLDISGFDITNALYAIVMKNEGSCDSTLNYPHGFFHIKIHDITAFNIHQDCFYLLTTDPYNTGRPVVCNGKTIYPRGSRGGWIEVYNCHLDSIQRSGIQLSNCDTGTNSIHDCYVHNTGFEFNNSQGGGFIAGSATTNISFYNDTAKKTWDHGIWGYPTGLCKIYNCVVDSSGFSGGKMQSYDISPLFLNSYTNPSTAPKLQFKIYNNKTGVSTDHNGYSVALFNGSNDFSDTGNVVYNSGKIYTQSGITFDTTMIVDTTHKPPPPPKDTTILYFTLDRINKTATFHRADSSILFFINVDRCVGSITNKNWTVFFNDKTSKKLQP